MAHFATLSDVKAYANVTSSEFDGELTLMLDAAEDVVRSLIRPVSSSQVTERVTAHGGTVLLSGRPVGDVLLNGGAVTGFWVDAAAGLLHDVPTVYGPLTASYTVGNGNVPAAVTLATAIIAGHLFETQRMPGQMSDRPAGFGGLDGVPDMPVPGQGYALPNRAQQLLEPFMLPVGQIA